MPKPNIFNQVKLSSPPTSRHDLSHTLLTSTKFGLLLPILNRPMLPGQSVHFNADVMMRLAPLTSPVMGRARVYVHFGFVPYRVLWKGWFKYISSGEGVHPFLNIDGAVWNKLCDAMRIPDPNATDNVAMKLDAFPFAAYQKFYMDCFRDQNLIAADFPTDEPFLDDGDNVAQIAKLLTMRNRAYPHDYYTSALPFAQKGDPVTIPFRVTNDVEVIGDDRHIPTGTLAWDATIPAAYQAQVHTGTPQAVHDATQDLYARTSEIETTATINDLRRAWAIQKFLERNAVGGTRDIEFLLAHFKVRSSDKRLQRTEFITSTKANIMISEVLSTVQFDDGVDQLPQGNMSGHGIAIGNGRSGSYFAEEHGMLVGIMSVLPEPIYYQGVDCMLTKVNDPYEYGFPLLANLGEEAIKYSELYGFTAIGNTDFGYKSRYAEYKYMASACCGDFRTTLRSWTFARQFAAQPTLSQAFIECDSAQTDHIFAVTDPDIDKLWATVRFNIQTRLPLPYFGTPGGL